MTYASELWILKDNDIRILEAFQRYTGRKVQKFPHRFPNETSFVGLGWMRLELYTSIYVKKLLFVRTVSILDDTVLYKSIFIARARQFDNDRDYGFENPKNSPCFDILKVAYLFDLYEDVMRIITGAAFFSKQMWRNLVWSKAWALENRDWDFRSCLFKATTNIKHLKNDVHYLIWWQIPDNRPDLMANCETMAKLVCKTSKLK